MDALKCKISNGKTRQRAKIKRKSRLDVEIKMKSKSSMQCQHNAHGWTDGQIDDDHRN